MKTGLVIEGGGMKGIFSAGVTDRFLEYGLHFDYLVGTSAGGAAVASFLAGQYKRTYRFYHEYGQERKFLSLYSYLKCHQLFGLNYIYDEITGLDGKDPLNYPKIERDPAVMELCATNAWTGKPHYFSKTDMHLNSYAPLKASCAIPIACEPVVIDGIPYVDGGCSDPIPVQRAFDQGCDFVVVVLAKCYPYHEKPHRMRTVEHFLKSYPNLVQAISTSNEVNSLEAELAFAYQAMGKALVLMPEEDRHVHTSTRNRKILQDYYNQGLRVADAHREELMEKIQCPSL